jgi:hypothetical protein
MSFSEVRTANAIFGVEPMDVLRFHLHAFGVAFRRRDVIVITSP